MKGLVAKVLVNIQLLLKSLNTPADLLSQLH